MFDLSEDIHSLTDFKRQTLEFLERLRSTGRPVVLTVNGRAELVVQSVSSYQSLLDANQTLKEMTQTRVRSHAAGRQK